VEAARDVPREFRNSKGGEQQVLQDDLKKQPITAGLMLDLYFAD
jgi:hypothetical protein